VGSLRKLEPSLNQEGPEATAAKNRVLQILAEDPTFAYAELLAERYKLWLSESDTLPTFAVYFERALRETDVALLQRLTVQYPKVEAMCVIARVALGDETAFDKIADALRTIKADPSPECVTLNRGLQSILPDDAEEAKAAIAMIRGRQEPVQVILRAANGVVAID
jgi:hypothetical protein